MSMSVQQIHTTIVVLMHFVITPTDPTTAHVNQDMKGTEIIAQVIFFVIQSFCVPSKALLFLFFHNKMLFINFCQTVDNITSVKILSGKFITLLNVPCILNVLSPNMAGIRNFAFLFFLMHFLYNFLLSAGLTFQKAERNSLCKLIKLICIVQYDFRHQ